jgi:hypothetical protein
MELKLNEEIVNLLLVGVCTIVAVLCVVRLVTLVWR